MNNEQKKKKNRKKIKIQEQKKKRQVYSTLMSYLLDTVTVRVSLEWCCSF